MTSLATSFRSAVTAAAAAALNIDFVNGKIEGPIIDGDLGCAFPANIAEAEGNVTVQLVTVLVRVFLRFDRSEEPEAPLDPEPLEQAAATLETALAAIEVGTGGIWYSRVTAVEFDMDRNALEATVVGWNQGAFGDP